MKRNIPLLILLLAVLPAFLNCSGDKAKKPNVMVNDSAANDTTEAAFQIPPPVPPPIDLYSVMKDMKVPFNADILHSPDLVGNYNTTTQKALNLGIYTSDLAYCIEYEQMQKFISLFKIANILSEELKVKEGFDKTKAKSIEDKQGNIDTLFNIAMDSYNDVCSHLQEQGKSDVLALMIIGGWVESVYIATQTQPFDKESVVIGMVVDQVEVLEQILEMLKSFEEKEKIISGNEEIATIQAQLIEVYDLLNKMDPVNIVEKDYKAVLDRVAQMRSSFVGEDGNMEVASKEEDVLIETTSD